MYIIEETYRTKINNENIAKEIYEEIKKRDEEVMRLIKVSLKTEEGIIDEYTRI